MLPLSCLWRSPKLDTRLLEMVMPSQLVMSVVVVQFRGAVPRRVSLADKRVSQSVTRPAGSGSGMAAVLAHVTVVCCAATGVGVLLSIRPTAQRKARTDRMPLAEIRYVPMWSTVDLLKSRCDGISNLPLTLEHKTLCYDASV